MLQISRNLALWADILVFLLQFTETQDTNMMIGNAKNTMAVRTTVSWYLWTHQLIEVTGKDAAPFLDLIFANPIATLKVGRERYTTMLNEQAKIIDDVVVIRLKEEKFWISTLLQLIC